MPGSGAGSGAGSGTQVALMSSVAGSGAKGSSSATVSASGGSIGVKASFSATALASRVLAPAPKNVMGPLLLGGLEPGLKFLSKCLGIPEAWVLHLYQAFGPLAWWSGEPINHAAYPQCLRRLGLY